MEARRKSEVWEIVNRERKKRNKINEGIEMREWEKHFKRLLGGVEGKVTRGEKKTEEKEISREEIREVVRKIKDGKAVGTDEVPGELWKYGRGRDGGMDMGVL